MSTRSPRGMWFFWAKDMGPASISPPEVWASPSSSPPTPALVPGTGAVRSGVLAITCPFPSSRSIAGTRS